MYDYNNYNQEHKPAEITYYPEDYTKKKKPHTFLKVLGGLLFAVVISASSIGGYIALSGNAPQLLTSSSSSSQASSSSDNSSSTENQSLIKLASKTNALSIPEIVKKATPSVVGISSVFPSTSSSFNFQGITPSEQTATG
ncbi:MAG: hypothetical protein N2Z57_03450, partial [Oscillospiraceae bacterium]|nr:hypothetical protein [Oscillospiraceae bacterium]